MILILYDKGYPEKKRKPKKELDLEVYIPLKKKLEFN